MTTETQVPEYEIPLWKGRSKDYCVIVPVINEGDRIRSLLSKMKALNTSNIADVIIVDGGSTDGSIDVDWLLELGVRGLIVKIGPGKLSAQLRCGYFFALQECYQGIITIDGNDKDDPAPIPEFINALENGVDFVQGSRFILGGVARNTPKLRYLAVRLIHAPVLRLASGFKWTDTTQGFRAYSHKVLVDPDVAVFREVFSTYELLAYLSYRLPRLGYKCLELPTTRCYPEGKIPTKITKLGGGSQIVKILLKTVLGLYNPES